MGERGYDEKHEGRRDSAIGPKGFENIGGVHTMQFTRRAMGRIVLVVMLRGLVLMLRLLGKSRLGVKAVNSWVFVELKGYDRCQLLAINLDSVSNEDWNDLTKRKLARFIPNWYLLWIQFQIAEKATIPILRSQQ